MISPYSRVAITQPRLSFSGAILSSFGIADCNHRAFYGGHWRDIRDDFRQKISKEGNAYVTARRCDNGYRNYRIDRGLIIERKGDRDDDGKPRPAAKRFTKSELSGFASGVKAQAMFALGAKLLPRTATNKLKSLVKNPIVKKLYVASLLAGLALDAFNITTGRERFSEVAGRKVGYLGGFYITKGYLNSRVFGKISSKASKLSTKASTSVKEQLNKVSIFRKKQGFIKKDITKISGEHSFKKIQDSYLFDVKSRIKAPDLQQGFKSVSSVTPKKVTYKGVTKGKMIQKIDDGAPPGAMKTKMGITSPDDEDFQAGYYFDIGVLL